MFRGIRLFSRCFNECSVNTSKLYVKGVTQGMACMKSNTEEVCLEKVEEVKKKIKKIKDR